MVIIPLGYTVREVFRTGGNPYGASYTSADRLPGQVTDETLDTARAQGARLARFAAVLASARASGELPPPGAMMPFPAKV